MLFYHSFSYFQCLVNIATVLSTQELLSKLFIKLAMSRFRTLERLPLQITRRILFESKMVTLAEIGTLSVLLIYSASYFRLFGNEKFVYGVVLFKRTFTKMADYFCLVYFSTLPILAYVAFINGGVIIYTLMHLRFYMFLINGHLEQIFVDYDLIIDDYAKLKDQNYQEEVFEQLKNCIERHQPIKLFVCFVGTIARKCFEPMGGSFLPALTEEGGPNPSRAEFVGRLKLQRNLHLVRNIYGSHQFSRICRRRFSR